MNIFLAGVSCVGKTTLGKILADRFNYDKRHYLKEIKKDITYFGKTYKRAHLLVNISGLSIEDSVTRIQDAIQSYVAAKMKCC